MYYDSPFLISHQTFILLKWEVIIFCCSEKLSAMIQFCPAGLDLVRSGEIFNTGIYESFKPKLPDLMTYFYCTIADGYQVFTSNSNMLARGL